MPGRNAPRKTITSFLIPYLPPIGHDNVERYRIEWERLNGPTDLTKYYASRWPAEEANALKQTDLRAYFTALPEFYQDFLRQRMEAEAKAGRLDDTPEGFLELFLSGGMRKGRNPPRTR